VFRIIALAAASAVVARLVNLAAFGALAKTVGILEFAKITYAEAFFTYVMLISDMGLKTIGLREVARYGDRPDTLAKVIHPIVIAHLSSTGFLCLVAAIYLSFVPGIDSSTRLLTLLYLACVSPLSVFTLDWVLTGKGRLHVTAVGRMATELVFAVLILTMIRGHGDLDLVPISYGVAIGLVATFNCTFLFRNISLTRVTLPSANHIFSLLRQSTPIAGAAVVGHLWTRAGVFYLMTVDPHEAALFAAALKFFLLGLEGCGMLAAYFSPKIARSHLTRDMSMRELIRRFQQMCIPIAAVSVLVGIGLADQLIVVVFGPQALQGSAPLMVLFMALALWALGTPYWTTLLVTDCQKRNLVALTLSASCSAFIFLFGPVPGALGAAIALTIGCAIYALICYVIVRNVFLR
jgi:O-antigen/teichoic acid export membrane protein